MSPPHAPLLRARLISLSLAFCFAVIAGCVGLNSLIKSNQSQSKLKKEVPPPTVITINVSDVFNSGVFATTINALVLVLIFIFITGVLSPRSRAFFNRTIRIQAVILALCVLWMIASMVPFTLFFATRSADVRAFLGTNELPQSIVQATAASMGVSAVYKDIGYLRLVAIFPWISILFTAIASAVLFATASRQASIPLRRSPTPSIEEKAEESHEDLVKA